MYHSYALTTGIKISLMRDMQLLINNVALVDYAYQVKYFAPDLSISQGGLFTVINATDFMIRWDGG